MMVVTTDSQESTMSPRSNTKIPHIPSASHFVDLPRPSQHRWPHHRGRSRAGYRTPLPARFSSEFPRGLAVLAVYNALAP